MNTKLLLCDGHASSFNVSLSSAWLSTDITVKISNRKNHWLVPRSPCMCACMTICVCMHIRESPDQSAPCCPCPANLAAWLFHSHQSCNSNQQKGSGRVEGEGGERTRIARQKGERKKKCFKKRIAGENCEIFLGLRAGLFFFHFFFVEEGLWSEWQMTDTGALQWCMKGSGQSYSAFIFAPIKLQPEWKRHNNRINDKTVRQTEKTKQRIVNYK